MIFIKEAKALAMVAFMLFGLAPKMFDIDINESSWLKWLPDILVLVPLFVLAWLAKNWLVEGPAKRKELVLGALNSFPWCFVGV